MNLTFADLQERYSESVSDAASNSHHTAHGVGLLPRDLTLEELAAAPVLSSIDSLLIDDLSDDEDDAFAFAVGS